MRIRCPKCEAYQVFDDTRYQGVQSLVFVCSQCRKQFSVQIGVNDKAGGEEDLGHIVVIENRFTYRQELPLSMGDNLIGRRFPGTTVQVPIETSDTSMDHRHCIINVKRNGRGEPVYTLRDNRSLTGTFLNNDILGNNDRRVIGNGAIVTLGATTFMLRTGQEEE